MHQAEGIETVLRGEKGKRVGIGFIDERSGRPLVRPTKVENRSRGLAPQNNW